jgi:hypothetical protein
MTVLGMPPRDDQKHLVARGAVFRTEAIDGGAKAAGSRPVEVGDLNDTHITSETVARVRSTI